jgi:hypothetical protein
LEWTLGSADGRHAQPVADPQPVLGRNPALVDPYLAAAQDAVDVALGHTLGDAQQEVVDALAFGLLADLKPCHRIFAQVLHLQYTAPLVSRPVTVCPAARSGVGGTVSGMLLPPLLSLFSDRMQRGDKLTKAPSRQPPESQTDRHASREPQGISLARKSDTT